MQPNEMLTLIEQRRSIRKYTEEPIAEEQLAAVLRAGFYAPSSKACFPTHFVVVTDADKRAALSEILPYATMARRAPVCIVVCGDSHRSWNRWPDDCAAALTTLLLAAEAIGLGACWCGAYPRADVVEGLAALLELPQGILPYAVMTMGHPAEQRPVPERVEPARIHRERW